MSSDQCYKPFILGAKIENRKTEATTLGHISCLKNSITLHSSSAPQDQTFFNVLCALISSSVTRFGKISPLWQIRDIIGLIFIVANGQILKNNIAIRSNCSAKLSANPIILDELPNER